MKKIFIVSLLFLLFITSIMAQLSQGANAWVSARTVTLKSSTGFFTSNTGTVSYADQVTVLQLSGKWAHVRSTANSSLSGWMHSANLSGRRIVLSPSTGSATASEVALAGKSFDRDIENAYKARGNLNFADVDRTEANTVPQDVLFHFITEGRLAMGDN